MKMPTRAWRRWGERAARWTLTLLLVALVGVTVASGWWQVSCGRAIRIEGGAAWRLIVLDVRRGSASVVIGRSEARATVRVKTQFFQIRRYPHPAYTLPTPATSPFNLWRIRREPFGWTVALTYPVLAVALPTLFLWYRRIRRGYGRGHCQRCGYDLAGLAVTDERITCPECGARSPAPMLKASPP